MHSKEQTELYLPAPKVWARYGVSSMTLHRWLHDPAMEFPRPHYLGRYRFFRLSDLEAWERSRPREMRKAG